jgi:hypothetical protein
VICLFNRPNFPFDYGHIKQTDHINGKCHSSKNCLICKETLFHRLKIIVVGEDHDICALFFKFSFFLEGLLHGLVIKMGMPLKF